MNKCSIIGCNKDANGARGYCRKHYAKWQRHGDANYVRKYAPPSTCSIEGCERKAHAKGLCSAHRMKLSRTGTLDKIVGTDTWRTNLGAAKMSELAKLDPTKDTGPGRRGYLAVNVVDDLKQKARKRGIEWTLTPIEAYKLMTGDCLYHGGASGWPLTRNGIDRVDNTKGYHIDNCVSCCSHCNSAKMGRSLEEFIDWIKQVYHTLVKEK